MCGMRFILWQEIHFLFSPRVSFLFFALICADWLGHWILVRNHFDTSLHECSRWYNNEKKKPATAATKWWFGIVHIYCETKNLLLGEFFSGFVKKVIVKWNICEQFVVVHRTKWFFSVRDFRPLWLVFCCLCCPFAAFFISDHANISSASKQMSAMETTPYGFKVPRHTANNSF